MWWDDGQFGEGEARAARIDGHDAFDRLWRNAPPRDRRAARSRTYAWLASQLGIETELCHFKLFDGPTCLRAVRLCKGVSYPDVRAWARINLPSDPS